MYVIRLARAPGAVGHSPFRTRLEVFNDTSHLGMQQLNEFASGVFGAKL